MSVKYMVGLVAMLGASTAACLGAPDPEPVATTSAALYDGRDRPGPDDAPMPLGHPDPVFDFPSIHTPSPVDPESFNEPWERNPMSRGCYVTYVSIFDPAQGRAIELPITVCN